MFWKRKARRPAAGSGERPLYECNPAELDLNMLHHLQAGLIAKLVIANREILGRYDGVLAQAASEKLQDERTRELGERARRLRKLNTVLEGELALFQEGFQRPLRH